MNGAKTVFIVDDDPAIRDSLQAMLTIAGYSTRTFETAKELLDSCDESTVGCVLLDVRMPDMNGLDVQRQLNLDGIGLRVIIITGHGDIQMAVRAMREGAVDFIEKPFSKEVIVDSIERSFRGTPGQTASAGPDVSDEKHERLERLTPRERDVLEQLVIGHPNKVIAYELDISPRTVEVHRARVMEKMNARNLSQLVRMAIAAGINPESD